MSQQVAAAEHAALMDRVYHYTRYVYDISREYFLLGRDRMLRRMPLEPGQRILEMGCGTARNLIRLAQRCRKAHYYGLDASRAMLQVAGQKVRRSHLVGRVELRFCLAEQMHPLHTFGIEGGFDHIFFSYALSMMPTWDQALDASLEHLNPDGVVHIVDFWDQGGFPTFAGNFLKGFLAKFHVQHRPELMDRLMQLRNEGWQVDIREHWNRYAYLAEIRRA